MEVAGFHRDIKLDESGKGDENLIRAQIKMENKNRELSRDSISKGKHIPSWRDHKLVRKMESEETVDSCNIGKSIKKTALKSPQAS